MEMENKKIKESVFINLRSVVESCKDGVPLSRLDSDYKLLVGGEIPFETIGYKTLEELIKDNNKVFNLEKDTRGQLIIKAVTSSSTKHLTKLISKQKGPKHKSLVNNKKYNWRNAAVKPDYTVSNSNSINDKQELLNLKSQLEKEKKVNHDLSIQLIRLNSLIKVGQESLTREQELVKKLESQVESLRSQNLREIGESIVHCESNWKECLKKKEDELHQMRKTCVDLRNQLSIQNHQIIEFKKKEEKENVKTLNTVTKFDEQDNKLQHIFNYYRKQEKEFQKIKNQLQSQSSQLQNVEKKLLQQKQELTIQIQNSLKSLNMGEIIENALKNLLPSDIAQNILNTGSEANTATCSSLSCSDEINSVILSNHHEDNSKVTKKHKNKKSKKKNKSISSTPGETLKKIVEIIHNQENN